MRAQFLDLYECTLRSKPLYVWQCKNLIPTTSYKQWCWNKVLHLCMMLYWQVILKVLVPESLENNFLLNLQILSLFKPIHHKLWKNCKFISFLKVFGENYVNVIHCFIKWWKPCFLISEKVFHQCREFAHETSHIKRYDSTSGSKISMFEKIGGRGCGSEQAP